MQAPEEPINISVTFGKEDDTQNLIKFDVDLNQGEAHSSQFAQQHKIPYEQGSENMYLGFDFYVEAGKEQTAVEYFKKAQQQKGEEHLSPLQRAFRYKGSTDGQGLIINKIQPHPGFVRVYYEIQSKHNSMNDFFEQFKPFEESSVDISSNLSFQLKGSVSHNKKNRQNVKVDYAKIELLGTRFLSPELTDFLISMQFIESDDIQYFNPYLDLIKKSKKTRINMKFDSFRKINRYYNSVAYPDGDKQPETKGFPYTNQGIFRKKAQFFFLFKKYSAKITAEYDSEDVFIRLIKVYGKALNKMFDTDVLYR